MTARVILFAIIIVFIATVLQADEPVSFIRDVAPILTQRCSGCHGTKKNEGGYRVHSFEQLTSAGDSEIAPIVAGRTDESELYLRIVEEDESIRMPQEDDPLSAEEQSLIRRWIEQGAKYDGEDRTASLKSQLPPREHPPAPKTYRLPVPVFALAFAPNGTELAVGGYHEVTIWDPQDAKLLRRIGGLPERIHSLQFSKNGEHLLIGGGSPGDYGELTLVEYRSGKRLRTFGTFDDVVLGVAFSTGGRLVAAGAADRSVRVYETDSGRLVWESKLHSDWVTGVSFSHDGRFLASAGKDMAVKVYEAETGELFTTFTGHNKQIGKFSGRFAVYDVDFSAEELRIFSAGEDPVVRIWNPIKVKEENGTARDMEKRFAKEGHVRYLEFGDRKTVFDIALEDGQVFSVAADGLILQHDVSSGELVRRFSGHADWVFAVDAHADSRRLASGAFDGEVRIWNIDSGECRQNFNAAPGWSGD